MTGRSEDVAERLELSIDVIGLPAPQGSKQGFARGGHVVLVEMAKHLPAWRKAVVEATARQMRLTAWTPLDGPVEAFITFVLPRPPSVKRALPCVAPDIDKLARAVLDAIGQRAGAGAIIDDALVVSMHLKKVYAHSNSGALIRLRAYEEIA